MGELGQGGGLAGARAGLQGQVFAGVEGVGRGSLFVGRVQHGAAPEVRVRQCPTAARRWAGVVWASRCSIEDLDAWAAPLSSGAHANPAVRRMLGRPAWVAVQSSPVGSSAWRAGARLLDAQWAANRSLQGVSAEEITALKPERRQQLVKDLVHQAGNGYAVAARMRDVGMLRVEDVEWWLEDLRQVRAEHVSSAPAFFALDVLAD
ncbi:hypothetical protein ACFWD1_31710, partial [Micromonospora chalcea]